MTHATQHPALLPSGLSDLCGPAAQSEAALVTALIAQFQSCGYARVQPPLMEFSQTLLRGSHNDALAQRSFRVMDPLSGQMLALRADMTMQVARIAASALGDAPRPLRLCYAGQTLRTLPDAMRQTRHFRQIGIELYGTDSMLADVEVMQLAVSALQALDLPALTLDINLPHLLPVLLEPIPETQHATLLKAIRHKDVGQIEQAGQPLLAKLCAIAHSSDRALEKLKALSLPKAAQPIVAHCEEAISLLTSRLGDANALNITLDPLEMRGFGYHSGLSFAVYAQGRPQELGRGGRYQTPQGEAATGFTLYGEDILPLLADAAPAARLLLPAHCDEATAAHWRAQGYQTLYALGGGPAQTDFTLNDELTEIVKV
jgi:ATP phosphoribosyltransferase regulatory subunit